MTDRTVATAPAMKATSTVLRPPASSWENTSCCSCVVPSRCAALGGCGVPLTVDRLAVGLYGVIIGPMTARIRNAASSDIPTMILGDRGIRNLRSRPGSRTAGVPGEPARPAPGPPAPGPPAAGLPAAGLPAAGLAAGPPGPGRSRPGAPAPVSTAIAHASWRVRGSRNR